MKLNKKGYMLVEIVIAFGIAMAIAYYLMNLTYKFKNTNEDIYQSTIYLKDKISITKNIMNDLEKGKIIAYNIPKNNTLDLTIELNNETPPQQRRLEIDSNNKIIYGKWDGEDYIKNDVSYYEKSLDESLIVGTPEITTEGDYFSISIPVESIYGENNYDIKLFGQKDFMTVDFDLNYFPTDMNNWEHTYPDSFNTTYNNSTNMNSVAVTCVSGWEIVYTPMPVEKDVTYTITFNYTIPTAYQASYGIIYQVLKNLPTNSNNSSNSIKIQYLPATAQNTMQTATISFKAEATTTYYFAFNWGTTADGVTTTINAGNFKITNSKTPSQTVTDNSTYGTAISTPTRAGYTFVGWYTEKNGGNRVTSSTTVPEVSNHTLYAKWILIKYDKNYLPSDVYGVKSVTPESYEAYKVNPTKTVNNDANYKNGKEVVFTMSSTTDAGPHLHPPNHLNEWQQYTWSVYLKASKDVTLKIGSEEGGTKDVKVTTNYQRFTHTFTASRNINNNYSFIFYIKGSSWNANDKLYIHSLELAQTYGLNTENKTHTYDGTLGTLLEPTIREGYDFLGWYTAPVGGTKIDSSTPVPNTDTTYYAHWIKN